MYQLIPKTFKSIEKTIAHKGYMVVLGQTYHGPHFQVTFREYTVHICTLQAFQYLQENM